MYEFKAWLLLVTLRIVLAITIRVDEISKTLKKNKNKKKLWAF